jgi:hypothetical protein
MADKDELISISEKNNEDEINDEEGNELEEKLNDQEELLKEAKELFREGKYLEAADIYADILEYREEIYGEKSPELLSDISFLYAEGNYSI